MLLQTNGAALIKDGPIYRIEPEGGAVMATPGARLGLAGQSLPVGYQLRVVPLRYVSVKDMQKVIEPLMPPKSVVRADEIRNLLMLAGSSEELESAIETIRLFDVDFMRGMTVGIYPLKNVDAATIVQELDKLLGDIVKGPLAGMLRLLPIQRLNAILVVSPQPRYLDEVESWIERLDRYDTGKATGNMHVYRVQNVDAVQLAQTLSQIFGGAAAARGTPAAQLAPGLTGAAISGGAFGGTAGAFGGTGGAFGGTGGAFGGTGGAFGGTGTGAYSGGMGTYQVEDQGIGGTTTGTGTTGGSQIGTGASSTGGLGGGMAGGTLGGTTSGRAGPRGSVVAELGNDRRIVADPANNALIIFAKAQDYKDIEAVIKELDVLPLQVLIDATIAEVTLTGKLEYGIKWLFNQGSSAEALAGTSGLLDKIKNIAITGSGPGGFAYAFAGKDIKVLLTALANDNKVNVVSSPSLMVLNNQEANINVGDKVPTSSGGGIITTTGAVSSPSIQYVESGVILKVRPRVNSGGLVIMDIAQATSVPTQLQSSTGTGNAPLFQFAQRIIQSQVAVNDGDTLALGGLIQNRDTRDETGIPWLNKIPGLGWLFGSTTKNVLRTELVVLLTPRVVEKRRDVTTVANEFRRKLTGIFEEYRLSREAPRKSTVAP
ncbi:MAG TPA: type II secretion system secretin GspD, partial [Methylococcaceae bacterium]|nr:type II secretion system secretin GspD [Methylococcaceae bacterium]